AGVPRALQHGRVAGFDVEISSLFGEQVVQWRSTEIVGLQLHVNVLPRQIPKARGIYLDCPACFTIADDRRIELCLRGQLSRRKRLLFGGSLCERRGDSALVAVSHRKHERGSDGETMELALNGNQPACFVESALVEAVAFTSVVADERHVSPAFSPRGF